MKYKKNCFIMTRLFKKLFLGNEIHKRNPTMMFDIPEKHWISFSDLYPCIAKDPLQIYMKHHLQFPAIPYQSSSGDKKEEYFKKNQDKLYYMSDKPSRNRFVLFSDKIEEKTVDFYSVPIYNVRYKWKAMIDMIVRETYIDKNGDKDKYVILLLMESKTITEYRKYQAHFYSMMLHHNKNIDTEIVYVKNVCNGHIQKIHTGDKHIQKNIVSYCKWIRNCMNYGSEYKLDPPSHPNLYPNMKVVCNDKKYDDFKKECAKACDEITLLWRCHPKHREIMHRQGIYSYMDDRFDVSLLGLGKKYEFIVKKMIELKKDPKGQIYIGENDVLLGNNTEFYIDFETLDDIIYWVGIGFVQKGKEYKYISFTSCNPTVEEQYRIMKETKDFLSKFEKKEVYYWYAEKRFWERVKDDRLEMDFTDWVDMCQVFQDAPIIVKGAFDFKLKTIVGALNKLGKMDLHLPEGCSNGSESIELAKRYYKTREEEIFSCLKEYNEYDCKALYLIKKALV